MSPIPTPVAACIALASLAAFTLTVYDKVQARRGGWRVAERTLLGVALAGGTPGLLLGMALARHKTRKPAFLGKLALVLLAQGVAAYALLRP